MVDTIGRKKKCLPFSCWNKEKGWDTRIPSQRFAASVEYPAAVPAANLTVMRLAERRLKRTKRIGRQVLSKQKLRLQKGNGHAIIELDDTGERSDGSDSEMGHEPDPKVE